MAEKESPLDSPFEPAKPEETLALLQSAISRKSRLQCWSAGQKLSYTSRIVKVHETNGLVSISVSKEFPGGEEFEAALIHEALEEILFSLHLPTDIIFFKAEPRRGETGYFNARVKPPIFKVQRRQTLRLPISPDKASAVVIRLDSDHTIGAELLNLSEGGVGIAVRDQKDHDLLTKATKPFSILFDVFGVRIECQATARHGSQAGSTMVKKSFRVGVAFEGMDPKMKTRLSQLVFEESSKFIGRY